MGTSLYLLGPKIGKYEKKYGCALSLHNYQNRRGEAGKREVCMIKKIKYKMEDWEITIFEKNCSV